MGWFTKKAIKKLGPDTPSSGALPDLEDTTTVAGDVTQGTDDIIMEESMDPNRLLGIGVDSNTSSQKVGGVVHDVVTSPGKLAANAYRGAKKGVAAQFGGGTTIRDGVKHTAEETLGGGSGKSISKTADDLSEELQDSFKNIGQELDEKMSKHNLFHPDNPTKIPNELSAVLAKYKDDSVIMGNQNLKRILEGIDKFLVSGGKEGTDPSAGLRLFRREVSNMSWEGTRHGGDIAHRSTKLTLDALKADVNEVFENQAKFVGGKMHGGGDEFLKEVLANNKKWSDWQNFKGKHKSVVNAGDDTQKALNYLRRGLKDPVKAQSSIKSFMDEIDELATFVDDPKAFKASQLQKLKTVMHTNLFDAEGGSVFKNFITTQDGREALQKLWPKAGRGIDDWARIFKETEQFKGDLGGWASKVAGMAFGGAMAAGLGRGVGTVLSAMGGAIGTGRLLNSKMFQKWAVKQFSAKPLPAPLAIRGLAKIMDGNIEKATAVYKSTVGYTAAGMATAGGIAGYGAHQQGVRNEENASAHKEFMRSDESRSRESDNKKMLQEFMQ